MTTVLAAKTDDDVPNREAILSWYLGLQLRVLSDPELAPLRAILDLDPRRLIDLDYMMDSQHLAMCRVAESLSAELLALVVSAIDGLVVEELGIRSPAMEIADVSDLTANLDREGHVRLPSLSPAMADHMARHFEGAELFDDRDFTRCSLADARQYYRAHFLTSTVAGCPHLLHIANDPATLSVVARHLGATPTILGMSAWWSFAGREAPCEEQHFHRDLADYQFCKLFVYLTDVDEDGGPHAFYPRTHDPRHVAALRERWPGGRLEFHKWFFHQLRKTDDETRARLEGSPTLLTGPAGTRLLVNTRGIHKGLAPMSRDRLVCQVIYGVSPFMQLPRRQTALFPATLGQGFLRHLSPRLLAPPRDYVNRLFVSPP